MGLTNSPDAVLNSCSILFSPVISFVSLHGISISNLCAKKLAAALVSIKAYVLRMEKLTGICINCAILKIMGVFVFLYTSWLPVIVDVGTTFSSVMASFATRVAIYIPFSMLIGLIVIRGVTSWSSTCFSRVLRL